jgi:hypothetical protein
MDCGLGCLWHPESGINKSAAMLRAGMEAYRGIAVKTGIVSPFRLSAPLL